MRIAVCLSGQLRGWEIGWNNQKWFWSTSGHEVDYFIHTWSYSGDRAGVTHEYEWRDISKKEYKDICDYYEVKDGIYDTTPQEWFYDNDHWSALFYSFAQSVKDGVGAGDALLSSSSLAYALTKNIALSLIIGNFSAAIACSQKGNFPVTKTELINFIKKIDRYSN